MKKQINFMLSALAACGILLLPSCSKEQREDVKQDTEQLAIQPAEEFPPAQEKTPEAQTRACDAKSIRLNDQVDPSGDAVALLRNAVAKGNVVIDFYASWCGPCKYMSPIIDELANERADVTFIKVDIDKHNDVAAGFELAGKKINIGSIPTFYLFKDGKIVDEVHGGMKKEVLADKLNTHFGK